MIGFLSVSAVSFWFAGDVFHVVQIRFGCICGIFFDCFFAVVLVFGVSFFGYFWVSGVPWGSFWQAFWVPGGPWDTILAPKVSFGGSEGPSWTAGGSRGGSIAKTSLFSFLFWDHVGVIWVSKIIQKSELKFD